MLDKKCGLISASTDGTLGHARWRLSRSRSSVLQQDSGVKRRLGCICPPRPDALEETFSGKSPLQASSKIALPMPDLEPKPTLGAGAEPGPASCILQRTKARGIQGTGRRLSLTQLWDSTSHGRTGPDF